MVSELAQLLDDSIRNNLPDSVAIAFSGGLDSTTIATVAKKYSKVELFTAGVKGSSDIECAQKIAEELSLPLFKVDITEKIALEEYPKCHEIVKLDMLKMSILLPAYMVVKAAAGRKHKKIIFGAAAEELFVGYRRYFDFAEQGKDVQEILKSEYENLPNRELKWLGQICKKFDIEPIFPFHNQKLADLMFSIPLKERMEDPILKKSILRKAAKELGVSQIALERKKQAMQFGSGMHKLLSKHPELENRTDSEG